MHSRKNWIKGNMCCFLTTLVSSSPQRQTKNSRHQQNTLCVYFHLERTRRPQCVIELEKRQRAAPKCCDAAFSPSSLCSSLRRFWTGKLRTRRAARGSESRRAGRRCRLRAPQQIRRLSLHRVWSALGSETPALAAWSQSPNPRELHLQRFDIALIKFERIQFNSVKWNYRFIIFCCNSRNSQKNKKWLVFLWGFFNSFFIVK